MKFIHKSSIAVVLAITVAFVGEIVTPLFAVTLVDSWTMTSTGLNNAFTPAYLALDQSQNHVFVGENGWGLVHTLTLAGTVVDTTVVAVGHKHIALDAAGNIYVSDFSGHHVLVYNSAGAWTATWGSPGQGPENFNRPQGINVGPDGNIYVADVNNCRVQVISPAGIFLRRFGSFGNVPGKFTSLEDLAIDAAGFIYTTENGAGVARVQKLTPYGTPVHTWGTPGNGSGQFGDLAGIGLDAQAHVYTTETNTIRAGQIQVFDSTGVYLGEFGPYSNGDTNGYHLRFPTDVVIDNAGTIYVADWGHSRVQVFSSITTGVNPSTPALPAILALPSPNPFNGQTTLRFNLPQESDATLAVYDVNGRKVVDWKWSRLASGEHSINWDGRAADGTTLNSGIFFCRLTANGTTETKKLVHLK